MLTAGVTDVLEILASEVVLPILFRTLTMRTEELISMLLLAVAVLIPKVCIHA